MRTHRHLLTLSDSGQDFRDWYSAARANIDSVCQDRGWCANRMIDVLAITSIRTQVRRNVRQALHYMETGTLLAGAMAIHRKLLAQWEETGVFNGPKIRAFASALRGDAEAVVLDVWMAKAMEVPHPTWGTKSGYREGVRRVRRAARYRGWSPAEMQAAAWAGIVRQHGRVAKRLRVSDELSLWESA